MRLGDLDALKEDFKSRLADCNEWIEKGKDKETRIRASAVKAFIGEVIMTINNAPTVEPNRVLYLCDGHGCEGCDEGTNEDHHCKHTSDISHARRFEAMTEPNGEIVGYYEKDEHVIAQINFDEEQLKQFSDEEAQRLRDEIERGELVLKSEVQKVIIHHNGRDTVGYYDRTRELLFGGFLTLDQCEKFGFTWTEVEEEDKNHES